MPACDGQTDRQTDGRTDVKPIAITCFSIADARKNRLQTIEYGRTAVLGIRIWYVSSKYVLSFFVEGNIVNNIMVNA